jgi:hypothetical protein
VNPLRIQNKIARQLWLEPQGLSVSPTGSLDLLGMVKKLGFVQLDSIQVVSRAHHHILWSRNQNYREPMLDSLLANDRSIFEHFTHDASVIPMEFLPFWKRQFRRKKEQLDHAKWFKGLPNKHAREIIKKRIGQDGPLSTHAFDTKITGQKKCGRAHHTNLHLIICGTLANWLLHTELILTNTMISPNAFSPNL